MSSQANLGDVLAGSKSIDQVAIPGPGNIAVVPGGAGDEELANLSPAALRRLLNSLKGLCRSYDYVIIDTAAGLVPQHIEFCDRCRCRGGGHHPGTYGLAGRLCGTQEPEDDVRPDPSFADQHGALAARGEGGHTTPGYGHPVFLEFTSGEHALHPFR